MRLTVLVPLCWVCTSHSEYVQKPSKRSQTSLYDERQSPPKRHHIAPSYVLQSESQTGCMGPCSQLTALVIFLVSMANAAAGWQAPLLGHKCVVKSSGGFGSMLLSTSLWRNSVNGVADLIGSSEDISNLPGKASHLSGILCASSGALFLHRSRRRKDTFMQASDIISGKTQSYSGWEVIRFHLTTFVQSILSWQKAILQDMFLRDLVTLREPSGACPELQAYRESTREDPLVWLWTNIDEAKANMLREKSQEDVELYTREWLPASSSLSVSNDTFKVMQFNLLAEGLSASPDVEPPFPFRSVPDWGGFDHLTDREQILDWRLRRWRLIEEILRFDPDVVAVEELDHFVDFFKPVMALAGYKGFWQGKPISPALQFGYYTDGAALFWKTSKFTQVGRVVAGNFKKQDGSDANQVFLTVHLNHSSGRLVRFGAAHLKAKSGEDNELLREHQANQLMDILSASPIPDNLVLCGDFNTEPFDMPQHKARAVPAILQAPAVNLRSAYPLPNSSDSGEYTTWKRRGAYEGRHVKDYIFHSESLRAAKILSVPQIEDVHPERLPGLQYPSDHIAIAAELCFHDAISEN